MKISITELRDMVAKAVRLSLSEAKKVKELPQQSDAALEAQRHRHVTALPGYKHGDSPLDMSKPLGSKSLLKKQGASNMGGWTSESLEPIKMLVKMIVREEIRVRRGNR